MERRDLLFATLALSLVACAPVYIAPSTNAMPAAKAGSASAAVYGGTNGLDGRVSVTPVERVVAHALVSDENKGTSTHRYGELAGGYIFRGRGNITALGGAGYGRSHGEAHFASTTWSGRGTYQRLFAQGGTSFESPYFAAGFTTRATVVRYAFEERDGATIDEVDTVLFIEPVSAIAVGPEWIRAEMQLGFTLPSIGNSNLDFLPLHISLGLRVKLH